MTAAPLLFTLLMWFIGTGAVVCLDSRPQHTFRASFTLAGLVALAAAATIWWTASDPSPTGAYVAFGAAILVWGWHEMGFLMGFVAGPRKEPCPPEAEGWQRFRFATMTVIEHEIALASTVGLLFTLTWGQPNQVAPLAFALLFVLRLSAKFNLFFGVPNLSDEVFPEHLAYLKSYFRKRACNPLFPVSILLGGGIAVWAWQAAEAAPAGSGAAVGATALTALAVLGVVEHLFLVLPLRDGAMWRWASSKSADKKSPNKTAAPAAIIE